MLTLNDGRAELWQWDTGRTLNVDADCSQVHFSNKVFGRSIDVDVIDGSAIIPDVLLQTDKDLDVWAFVGTAENGYTKISKTFKVNRRNKPADYVFTQTDQMTLQTIQHQIGDLADLTTESKENLVAAINEAARTGVGGGGSTVELDTTLTQSGKAADAAVVGNRLSTLSEEIVTTSESKVAAHNTGTNTHSDIRLLIQGLTDRLNALADSDDTTLDQLSEVVSYIKSNRSLIDSITTSKVSVADIIDNLTTNVTNKPLSAAQGVALKALIDGISVPDKLPNPNALTFSGAVTGSYDGSAPMSVEIPSGGGGSSGGSGKAKSQILIDQEITELTASLSVTLEHDFHNLTAIISCGSDGAALTAGSDGTAVASKIGLLIDTTDFVWNARKVAFTGTSTGTWKIIMFGAEWSDDLSVFKRSFAAEITTNTVNKSYTFPFGGSDAMYGTLGTEDNAPRTGKIANIVVNGAYLNVGTRVILWGEYYE